MTRIIDFVIDTVDSKGRAQNKVANHNNFRKFAE